MLLALPTYYRIKRIGYMINIEGHRLHYRIAGDGPPLVLLHGYGTSGYMWQWALPYLAEHHKVVIVDLPGYGRSTYSGVWQLRAMAPLLVSLLQHLQLSRVSLLGHSMGGAIAVHLTDYAPEMIERLVLINSAGLPLQANLSTLALRSLRSFLQREGGGYPPRLVLDVLRPHTRLLWQGAQEMMRSDFSNELSRITVPTLIIWGARDLLLPLQLGYDLHKSIPHSQLIVLPQSGHRPMLTQPQEFSRIVLEFCVKNDLSICQQSTTFGWFRIIYRETCIMYWFRERHEKKRDYLPRSGRTAMN